MKTLFLIFLTLVSSSVFAGQEGGGGMAVQSGTQYLLYDFIEAGLDTNTQLPQVPDAMNAMAVLKQNLPFSNDVLVGVASMLNLISEKHPAAAEVILEKFSRYVWQLPSQEIVNAKDIGRTPVVLENGITVIPVAIRDDNAKVVWIRKAIWENMSLVNRVGLLFHEVLYAISNRENSYRARTVNGFIFNPLFSSQKYEKISGIFGLVFANLWSPDQYRFLHSGEFFAQCEETKSSAKKLLRDAEKAFATLVEEIDKPLIKGKRNKEYCHSSFDEKQIHLIKTNVDGEEFIFPELLAIESVYTYRVQGWSFLYVGYDCGNGKDKELHAPEDAEINLFRSLKASATAFVEKENSNLYAQCFSGSMRGALENVSKMGMK